MCKALEDMKRESAEEATIKATEATEERTMLEAISNMVKELPLSVEQAMAILKVPEAMAQATGLMVCITDRDQVIAVSGGSKKDLLAKTISKQLEHAIGERNTVVASKEDKSFISVTSEEMEGITAQAVAPIICEGDAIGSVSLLSREPKAKMGDMEVKLVTTAAGFLGRQMEG